MPPELNIGFGKMDETTSKGKFPLSCVGLLPLSPFAGWDTGFPSLLYVAAAAAAAAAARLVLLDNTLDATISEVFLFFDLGGRPGPLLFSPPTTGGGVGLGGRPGPLLSSPGAGGGLVEAFLAARASRVFLFLDFGGRPGPLSLQVAARLNPMIQWEV